MFNSTQKIRLIEHNPWVHENLSHRKNIIILSYQFIQESDVIGDFYPPVKKMCNKKRMIVSHCMYDEIIWWLINIHHFQTERDIRYLFFHQEPKCLVLGNRLVHVPEERVY